MKTAADFPAKKRAFEFVKYNLDKGVWPCGDLLPPTRKLAAMAGVSRVTMSKAVTDLKARKLVHGLRQHRLRAGAQSANAPIPVTGKQAPWLEKRLRLEQDLIAGAYGLDSKLPSSKELQAVYGVCHRTVRKMLLAMKAERIIRPFGKGYVRTIPAEHSAARRVVYITCKDHFSQVSALNHEHNRIVNMIENECRRIGLHLEVLEIDVFDSVETRNSARAVTGSESTLGYILDYWGEPNGYAEILGRLVALRKPVAIIDELGNFEPAVQFQSNPLVQVYRCEENRAGDRVARYLLGLGHRSVAFISMFRDSTWSRGRYEGARSQFARAGLPDCPWLVADTFSFPLQRMLAASRLSDDTIRKIIKIGRTPPQARHLESLWMEIRKQMPSGFTGNRGLDNEIETLLGILAGHLKEKLAVDVIEGINKVILQTTAYRIFCTCLKSLFQKALKLRGTTAWICANDAIAFESLFFLRSHGIKVPGDLSVVGFDNIPATALEQRLTTFDFNAMGFIHQILSFLARPPRPRGPYRHVPIEIEGIILERASTSSITPV